MLYKFEITTMHTIVVGLMHTRRIAADPKVGKSGEGCQRAVRLAVRGESEVLDIREKTERRDKV